MVTETTDSDFNEKLIANNKVIVKFYAGWCGSCKLFAPKFKRLSNDEDNKDLAFLDVDAENNQVARKSAAVDNLPFFAIYHNGKLIKGESTSKEENVQALINELKQL